MAAVLHEKLPRTRDGWTPRRTAAVLLIALLAILPPVAAAAGHPFYLQLFTRIVIYAIAAVSLNLLLGYGGLVSFGHALYLGLGAYVVGVMERHGIANGGLQLAMVVGSCAVVGALSGLVVLRTSGIAFIMITLAFAQMFFFMAVGLNDYGGDDGSAIGQASRFGPWSLGDPMTLHFASLAVLVAVLVGLRQLIHSRFGMVLRGTQANERRLRASGFPTLRYKLAAYVISAVVCGIAGFLLANLTLYISPSYMAWASSGELVVMVVLGGVGTLAGPVAGAFTFFLLEEGLKSMTDHWMMVMGLVIVGVVLLSNRGLLGLLRGRS